MNIQHPSQESETSLTADEAYDLLSPDIPLEKLMNMAQAATKKHHGNRVGACSIYALRVGQCGNDCAFCAQSVHSTNPIRSVGIEQIDADDLMRCVITAEEHGIGWFSLVTSGEELSDREFETMISIIERVRTNSTINLCASIGRLDNKRARALKQAGVSRYHHNIETSPAYFPQICSTHSYDDKLHTISVARRAGLEVCCGGIISMGESARDRVDMALAIRDLDVVSVPLNILNPIPGTRLEHQGLLLPDEILQTFAIFRLLLPDKTIRYAGGRENAMGEREIEGYHAGINALIAGNFLTTAGKNEARELDMLSRLGLEIDRRL